MPSGCVIFASGTNAPCSARVPEREEQVHTGEKTEAERANRSADMFDWQQNQPVEGCKLQTQFSFTEATQKAQMHPGSRAEAEPQRREALLEVRGGQQDEPGLALSPDGPGASPEPPSLTHTPDGNATTDTMASDLLRKLAESQEVNSHVVRVKEEEEPMDVNTLVVHDRPITEGMTPSTPKMASHHLFTVKTEDQGPKTAEQLHPGAKMAEQCLLGLKIEDEFYSGGCQPGSKTADGVVSGATNFQFRMKMEDRGISGAKMPDQLSSGAKMEEQLLFKAKIAERPFSGAKFLSGAKMVDQFPSGAKVENQLLSGAKIEEQLFFGAKMEDQFTSGAKMADQCLRAVLWQDMCHVCGFETEGRALFQSHMTEHRQWEHSSFSLHCYVCDHSTNQEAEMRAHADTHIRGDTGTGEAMRCTVTSPTAAAACSAPAVAMATQPETSTSEHRCRICQRSFPGQQELLVHFQGHRQGNQYRCDRCGHLTRTANKLVEHVRVHTGERPFTCDLCPYSAKRRDSLRLHCKVKHPTHLSRSAAAADAPGDVHTHRSYVHGDNQRSNKHVQRLHTPPNAHTAAHTSSSLPPLHPSLSDRAGWRDLSPLLPITTLISLKPRCPSSSSSSSSSSSNKHSFLGYLGLTSSL
ncbi:hypothetical protein PAMA_013641 [Pampus argenteus]